MEKPLILVIEDEPKQAEMIAKMINQSGRYEAVIALSAEEGFKELEKHRGGFLGLGKTKIKCIVLDIKMPEMDGLEFLKKLREQESPMELMPVIMLTAYEDKEKWSKATSPVSGMAVAYLKKPVKEEELISTIDHCLFGDELGTMIDKTRKKKYEKLEQFEEDEKKGKLSEEEVTE